MLAKKLFRVAPKLSMHTVGQRGCESAFRSEDFSQIRFSFFEIYAGIFTTTARRLEQTSPQQRSSFPCGGETVGAVVRFGGEERLDLWLPEATRGEDSHRWSCQPEVRSSVAKRGRFILPSTGESGGMNHAPTLVAIQCSRS